MTGVKKPEELSEGFRAELFRVLETVGVEPDEIAEIEYINRYSAKLKITLKDGQVKFL